MQHFVKYIRLQQLSCCDETSNGGVLQHFRLDNVNVVVYFSILKILRGLCALFRFRKIKNCAKCRTEGSLKGNFLLQKLVS